MQHHLSINIILFVATIITLMTGCTGRVETNQTQQPQDTIYTQKAAMMVYDYDPVRALQIVDSAVIVGNLSDWQADKNRARIYSQTRTGERFDSLMHWTAGARLDSAKAIGERLLKYDSVMNSLEEQQDVLEILAYTARWQNDSIAWLQQSQQLVEVCRGQGAETEALRNEAEVGAALCCLGRQTEGMARLDSVIDQLQAKAYPYPPLEEFGQAFRFNELDALIIALKRKIGVMTATGQVAEVVPLARRIVTLLDDYKQHPERYHDGTYREPPADRREDYIRFYRSQAENFIAAAYTALGQTDDMNATFERLENIIIDAEAREHHARYRALEHQLQRQVAESRSRQMTTIAIAAVALLLFTLLFAFYVFAKNRIINMKNRGLVKLIDEAIRYKERYEQLHQLAQAHSTDSNQSVSGIVDLKALSSEALFQYLCNDIREKRLYLDPLFDRQAVCDRYQLTAARVGSAFAQGSDYDSVADFVRDCRLEHACVLLKTTDMKIADVAAASGFSRATTFNHDFKTRYNLTPSEYRRK